MFEAGPVPCPSSRPDASRSLARQRVAPPSTPRKNCAAVTEPPKKFLNASRQLVCHAPKTNTRGIYHWYSHVDATDFGDKRGSAAGSRRYDDQRGVVHGRAARILP